MSATATHPEYESLRQAAERIGFSTESLRRKIEAGELAAYRISDKPGAAMRVKRSDVDALLRPVIPESVYGAR